MASLFHVWNEARSGGTQPRRSLVGGGFEAPRNSLDVASSFEATDNLSKSAGAARKPEDVPFGYEFFNAGRWKRDGREEMEQSEKRRRVRTNVVARLMGLDAMPDDIPTAPARNSLQEMPTYGGNPVLSRQRSQGAVPWQRPPLTRNVQRGVTSVEEARSVSASALPFRDHPQEEQLQKFKKEFEAKQQLEEMNRQLEEKKRKVRATLDKARIALSQGIIADPKRLNGLGKFEESQEFLEAMEFLQCNKDFIFQFLQQKPHVVFSNESFNASAPVTEPKPLKKGKGGVRDSTERRREGFSPRAIARLFMPSNSRKRNEQQPATPKSLPGARDLTPEDVKRRSSSSTSSRYMLPASPKVQIKPSSDEVRDTNKNGARAVIVEIKERLRRREQQSGPPGEEVPHIKDSLLRKHEHLRDSKDIAREIAKTAREAGSRNFTLTKSLSTGKRISMMRPDMDDMTCASDGEISTPKSFLTDPMDSPATLRAAERAKATKKTCLASESPRRGSPRSSTEGVQLMRRSASGVQNVPRSNVKLDSPVSTGKRLPHSVNDVSNVPLLRERGQCTNGTAKSTTAKVPKPAQNGDQRKLGLLSVAKKNGRVDHGAPEAMPVLPCPSPVRSRAAESCVSQSNTLDSAVNNRIHVTSSRNAGSKQGKDPNPRETKVRRNILDNVKDGQDSNREKNRQPSPVSPPFQEASSLEFIRNDHQDQLQIRLRRPKSDGSSERVRDNELENVAEREPPHQSLIRTSSTKFAQQQKISEEESPLHCPPPGPEADFAFVRDVLVTSGFHTHGGRNITRWHSATQPISHDLLAKVEGFRVRSSHRRIFFDAINEVLIAKLESSSTQCCALPIASNSAAISGRRFVEDVWGEILQRQFPERCQDNYFESLVAQDLRTTTTWLSLHCDVDRICLQLEKAIWSDLVEEFCGGLLCVN